MHSARVKREILKTFKSPANADRISIVYCDQTRNNIVNIVTDFLLKHCESHIIKYYFFLYLEHQLYNVYRIGPIRGKSGRSAKTIHAYAHGYEMFMKNQIQYKLNMNA